MSPHGLSSKSSLLWGAKERGLTGAGGGGALLLCPSHTRRLLFSAPASNHGRRHFCRFLSTSTCSAGGGKLLEGLWGPLHPLTFRGWEQEPSGKELGPQPPPRGSSRGSHIQSFVPEIRVLDGSFQVCCNVLLLLSKLPWFLCQQVLLWLWVSNFFRGP